MGGDQASHDHASHDHADEGDCVCEVGERPGGGAALARWLVHSLDWGSVSTISTLEGSDGMPFGNVYSFADGPCDAGSGVPYLLGSDMGTSFKDLSANPQVSLTLTEASLSSVCPERTPSPMCALSDMGDPGSPMCARVTLSGEFEIVDKASDEYSYFRAALVDRHPSMGFWPDSHDFNLAKINLQQVWLIGGFGGALIMSPEEYLAEDEEHDSHDHASHDHADEETADEDHASHDHASHDHADAPPTNLRSSRVVIQ